MIIGSHCRNLTVFFLKGSRIRFQIPLFNQIEKDATIVSCKLVDNDLIVEIDSSTVSHTPSDLLRSFVSTTNRLE